MKVDKTWLNVPKLDFTNLVIKGEHRGTLYAVI